eukprot:UN23558
MDGNGVLDQDELDLFFIRLTQEVVVSRTGKMPTQDQALKHSAELRKAFLGDSVVDSKGVSKLEFKDLGNLLMLTAITEIKAEENEVNNEEENRASVVFHGAGDFLNRLGKSRKSYQKRIKALPRAKSTDVRKTGKDLGSQITKGITIRDVAGVKKFQEELKDTAKAQFAVDLLAKLPNKDQFGRVLGAKGLPGAENIFSDLQGALGALPGKEGMDPFAIMESLEGDEAAAVEGKVKNILMKNFMTSAADNTGMSPAMKEKLGKLMEDPDKLAKMQQKLGAKMGGSNGELSYGRNDGLRQWRYG